MNKKTVKALRGSIAKWKAIAEGTGGDRACHNCPLCDAFIDNWCEKCPVSNTAGFGCRGTPYEDVWMLLGTPDVTGSRDDVLGRRAVTDKAKAAALAEQRFLESLLPEGELP